MPVGQGHDRHGGMSGFAGPERGRPSSDFGDQRDSARGDFLRTESVLSQLTNRPPRPTLGNGSTLDKIGRSALTKVGPAMIGGPGGAIMGKVFEGFLDLGPSTAPPHYSREYNDLFFGDQKDDPFFFPKRILGNGMGKIR